MKKPRAFDLSVYFIADPEVCAGRDLLEIVLAAVKGGATMVQLRNKSGNLAEFTAQAAMLSEVLKGRGVAFIVNDNIDIAFASEADGVHLGQDDGSAADARAKLGADKIIGVTAFEEAHFVDIDPALVDYVGTGPFFPTLTKPGKSVLGSHVFEKLVRLSPVPVVGIGGITPANARQVIQSGAAGVAMMRGISEAPDPALAAQQFAKAVSEARR